ncbi:O-acetylhomoserine aminocarboxypropyltransferase/cysteine synthase family protein [Spirochaeta africana]|uniref:OAH/OAS sulfhydrylase n=1 Tax=Spirochaeta africana (strain ATCC 700263 / DSM 8902 / Z-7692) TaxID=889378 RepID=H9UKP9_SPIAZ|nr:O-acetylhomoserine aminocarboxypropyltransferase/cysteine synthase family protein [Spirochaeta africana]AFG38092.1 OAH/OAS sulfhydrylase [Spirochaeta africana DSM 8902]
MSQTYKLETLALHEGQQPVEGGNPSRAVPISRTAAYNFRDTEHAANLFGLRELGYIYSRIQNPTQDVLEQRMTALEGGAASLALASGTSGVFYSIINIATAGSEIVSGNNLYGGTFTMFNNILPDYGITVRFADPMDPASIAASINDKTRAVFIETIGNPSLNVPDFEAIAEVAHSHGLPLIVDATFTTPALFRAIEYGADIVVNSLTKWIGGHGTAVGGIVTDAGRFDWKSERFPTMNEPEASYHNLRFAHDLGELSPLAYILRMRVIPLRNLGAAIAADNAWVFLQGMETLSLRMERHSSNALAAASYLQQHPKVEWVRYPGLPGDPSYENAKKYFRNGFGGMIVFGIKGGTTAGAKFIDSLELFSHVANVGDAKSLAIHPASTTHSQLNEEQQRAAGIPPEMVRLSIGIEHIDDILADIERGLNAV